MSSAKRKYRHGRVGVKAPLRRHELSQARRRGEDHGRRRGQFEERAFMATLLELRNAKDIKAAIQVRLAS